jgi:hypothetical protein
VCLTSRHRAVIRLACNHMIGQDHRNRNHRQDHRQDHHQSPSDGLESVLRTKIAPRLLWRVRSDEFLEARIISEQIEHRIEPEQCWSERYSGQARIR